MSGGGVGGGEGAARRSSRSSLTHSSSIALTPSAASSVSVGHSMDCAPSLVATAIQRLDPAFARIFLPPRAARRAL